MSYMRRLVRVALDAVSEAGNILSEAIEEASKMAREVGEKVEKGK